MLTLVHDHAVMSRKQAISVEGGICTIYTLGTMYMYDMFFLKNTEHKVKRQARKMMQRDH